MENLKFKTTRLIIVGIFISILALIFIMTFNINRSYADETFDEQGLNEQDLNLSYNETNEESLGESNDWYDDCDNERKADMLKPIYCEEASHGGHEVWRVCDGHFNKIKKSCHADNGERNDFIFEYDYRGYIGDENNDYGRKANVQFFFNSRTAQMAVLAFGGDEYDDRHDIYTYGGPATVTSIFEDKLEWDNDVEIRFNERVKYLYLDPVITSIGKCVFRYFNKCHVVDIINHCYKYCRMGNGRYGGADSLRKSCFLGLGRSPFPGEETVCSAIPFINNFCNDNRNKILGKSKVDIFGSDPYITFEDDVYWAERFVTFDELVDSVVDMCGKPLQAIGNNGRYYKQYNDFQFKVNLKKPVSMITVWDNNEKLIPNSDGTYTLDLKKYSIHNIKVETIDFPKSKISGQVHWVSSDGKDFRHITDANVDFIEDNGTIHHTTLEQPWGLFHFELYRNVKGKLHAYSDLIDGWLDYTVDKENDNNIYIVSHIRNHTVSGRIINDISSLKEYNIDLVFDNGKVLHKEYCPSHMESSFSFDFSDIDYGAKIKLHVYTSGGKEVWFDQMCVTKDIHFDSIEVK